MTKEQETIERLKYLLFIYKEDDSNKYKSTGEVFRIDFEAIETALSMLKEKDKQIDLMAEFISKQDVEEEICIKNKTNPDWCNQDYTNCKDCIKQYFERKTTNNG